MGQNSRHAPPRPDSPRPNASRMTSPWVCACGRSLDGPALLAALTAWTGDARNWLAGACPGCARPFEALAHAGRFEVGGGYFAGELHFETLGEVAARGLAIEHPDEETLVLRLRGIERRFAAPTESTRWLALFPGGGAGGRTLAEAGFAAAGVTVLQVQRDFTPVADARGHRLAPGDRLLCRGSRAALDRAWALLHRE